MCVKNSQRNYRDFFNFTYRCYTVDGCSCSRLLFKFGTNFGQQLRHFGILRRRISGLVQNLHRIRKVPLAISALARSTVASTFSGCISWAAFKLN